MSAPPAQRPATKQKRAADPKIRGALSNWFGLLAGGSLAAVAALTLGSFRTLRTLAAFAGGTGRTAFAARLAATPACGTTAESPAVAGFHRRATLLGGQFGGSFAAELADHVAADLGQLIGAEGAVPILVELGEHFGADCLHLGAAGFHLGAHFRGDFTLAALETSLAALRTLGSGFRGGSRCFPVLGEAETGGTQQGPESEYGDGFHRTIFYG